MRSTRTRLFATAACLAFLTPTSAGLAPVPHRSTFRGGRSRLGATSLATAVFDWRYFAAGGAAAALSHGVTTPIDVVKTRMQTEPEKYKGDVVGAALGLCQEEGVGYLLSGLAPTVVGYGIEGGLKFGLYEVTKPAVLSVLPALPQPVAYLLASVLAGAVAAVVLCPAEDVRIRLVADPDFADSAVAALGRIAREEGATASFRGLKAMLAKQIPYTMMKQVSFDYFTRLVYFVLPLLHLGGLASRGPAVPLVSGFLAACLACVASHPGDVVLTETFECSADDDPDAPRGETRTFGDICTDIMRLEGVPGFFVGIKARFAHVGSIITLQLVMYDALKVMLGLPATGSH